MLTDYDVVCYGFEPRNPDGKEMIVFCDEPPPTIFMGAVLGTAQQFETMAQIFADWGPDGFDWNAHAGLMHCDDLSMLVRMFETKNYPKPGWLVKKPGCGLYDFASWRTSKLVHYGYPFILDGHNPKHEFIEKVRPF